MTGNPYGSGHFMRAPGAIRTRGVPLRRQSPYLMKRLVHQRLQMVLLFLTLYLTLKTVF